MHRKTEGRLIPEAPLCFSVGDHFTTKRFSERTPFAVRRIT